jgi:diaminohydroxyphosphoribosylaminopyrimidine deaminase/5-amino-6-(5-phosphoribosylamino)uracil reductase
MTRALALAERGLETTHPNPRVGCVIAQGDRIIAEGWHERAGEAHAEVAAIRAAKEPVAGATAYVTLEPCSHHGRTPPCVNALIEARIARVVFAVQDPNPRVSGQGADALLRAGITVEAGLMQAEATELNIGFMKRMREGLPWVRVKLAMSLDGRTALANGASQWITSEHARNDVQRWRARSSAVMTGVGTVLADDPQLNVRVAGFKGRQPLRVVLDARLRSPVGAKMFIGLGAGAAGAAAESAAGPVSGAAGAASVATVSLAGDVLIFAAIGGGISAAGPARSGSAASAGAAALAGDMAELVNAFETSPTAVAARSADLAGPMSVKTESPVPAGAASGTSAGVAGSSTRAGANAAAGAAGGTVGAVGGAPGMRARAADLGAVSPGSRVRASAPGAGAPMTPGADGGAVASVPPTLAAAAAVSGVPTPADDATWAGAALSGAILVKSDAKAPVTTGNESATAGQPPADAGTGVTAPAPAPAAVTAGAALTAGTTPAATTIPPPPTTPAMAAPAGPQASAIAAVPASPALRVSVAPAAAGGVAPPAVATAPAVASAMTAATGQAAGKVPSLKAPPKADTAAAFQARRAALRARGVRIEEVGVDEGFLDLLAVLRKLAELEVNEVLVEAGPTLAGQLFTAFFADELLLYIAPKLLGPQGRPLVNLPELQSLQDAWGFALFDAKRFGDDLRLRMRPK